MLVLIHILIHIHTSPGASFPQQAPVTITIHFWGDLIDMTPLAAWWLPGGIWMASPPNLGLAWWSAALGVFPATRRSGHGLSRGWRALQQHCIAEDKIHPLDLGPWTLDLGPSDAS